MKSLRLAFAFAVLAAAPLSGQVERAAYLTLMGNDTLAIEWMEFGQGSVDAWALVRGNRTTFAEYRLAMSEAGELTAYTATVYMGGSSAGEVVSSERLVVEGSTRTMVTLRRGEESSREFTGAPGSVPFVDMLHWPFEMALRWQMSQGGLGDAVPTFTGRGSSFGLIDNGDGTWGLRHPSRGVSTMELDDDGRILWLDGTGSTRAYNLKRVDFGSLDMMAMGQAFADRPLGALSGRGQIDDHVAGVSFTGDYGAPVRRGRTIFGGLLAYGRWWRTGANAATQLSFDRDIVIDGEVVPAGDYSLSSIPEEDGGVLIINTRTGQGGQSYDPDLDQARVRMRRSMLDEKVEVFEIRVVEADGGGRIELRWDDVVYWVPFTAG
jgi:hypothetical protein